MISVAKVSNTTSVMLLTSNVLISIKTFKTSSLIKSSPHLRTSVHKIKPQCHCPLPLSYISFYLNASEKRMGEGAKGHKGHRQRRQQTHGHLPDGKDLQADELR